jgi:hypothetical protein
MKSILFCLCALFAFSCHAEEAGHWSVGVGTNYGGPGVKFSQSVSENIELYANAGLPTLFALLSYSKGSVASVGAEYALSENQHHTLSLAYAYLNHKGDPDWNVDEQKYVEDQIKLSGTVVGYTYYFSGLKSKGQAVGFSFVHLTEKKNVTATQTVGNADLSSISVSWGYRF